MIRLAVDADAIGLEVEDDGIGMARTSPGIGLGTMRERAAELGGTCRVGRAASGGTVVSARLPLTPVQRAG